MARTVPPTRWACRCIDAAGFTLLLTGAALFVNGEAAGVFLLTAGFLVWPTEWATKTRLRKRAASSAPRPAPRSIPLPAATPTLWVQEHV